MPARPLHQAWRRVDFPPIEWFIGDIDVVHGTNFVVPPARRAARIVTVHDLTPVLYPELCDQASLRYPSLVRRALHGGAWIHTHSAYVAREVIDVFGADPERVRWVHSGVPPLAPADSRAVEQVLKGRWRRYILAVGTIEPRKDLPSLALAFDAIAAQHDDLVLVLAGPDGWGREALDRVLSTTRHRDRIIQTGWLEPGMLAGLLRGASVLAYPSIYEGFGYPPLQAMAAGVPVVSTRAGSLPEVLGDAAILVPIGDPRSLAEALDQVLSSESLRADLVARGLAHAAEYSWDRCAKGLEDLYRAAWASAR
jgi:glycosyltransferase involved in cell wall biosynthesis